VIVRISEEGQYELDDSDHHRLNELDDAAVAAVDRDDEDGWHAAFEELLQFVRTQGTLLGDDDLRTSEIILPPADLTFVEAGEDFTGEGLVPDPA
jgi:PspA-Associated protein